MSAFTLFLDVGAAFGPSLLGLVAVWHTYEHAFFCCAGAAVLGLLLSMRWVPARPALLADGAGAGA